MPEMDTSQNLSGQLKEDRSEKIDILVGFEKRVKELGLLVAYDGMSIDI